MMRFVDATSSAIEFKGFWTATACRPLACSKGMSLDQLDPSAQAPWTSTTFFTVVINTSYVTAPFRIASQQSHLSRSLRAFPEALVTDRGRAHGRWPAPTILARAWRSEQKCSL